MPTTAVPRLLLILGLCVGLGGFVAMMASTPEPTAAAAGSRSPVAILAPLLLLFACYKAAIGLDAWILARRGGDARQRLQAVHGAGAGLKAWIAYKLLAALLATVAAVVIYSQAM
ncbi:MAG: hypothetical protein ACYTF0_06390 [Planctomycetota bacterium]|jgi:hypothetical protein